MRPILNFLLPRWWGLAGAGVTGAAGTHRGSATANDWRLRGNFGRRLLAEPVRVAPGNNGAPARPHHLSIALPCPIYLSIPAGTAGKFVSALIRFRST